LHQSLRAAVLPVRRRLRSGKDYEYRRAWIEERLAFLAGCFGIDVLGFAILSNHFHVILRNRPDVVDGWSEEEVARRWYLVCPARKTPDGLPAAFMSI